MHPSWEQVVCTLCIHPRQMDPGVGDFDRVNVNIVSMCWWMPCGRFVLMDSVIFFRGCWNLFKVLHSRGCSCGGGVNHRVPEDWSRWKSLWWHGVAPKVYKYGEWGAFFFESRSHASTWPLIRISRMGNFSWPTKRLYMLALRLQLQVLPSSRWQWHSLN